MKNKDNMFSLKEKISVITGGDGHLGLSMSEALLERGSKLYILGKSMNNLQNAKKKLKEKGLTGFEVLKTDISKQNSIQKQIEYIEKYSGKIDVLINNAYFGHDGNFQNKTEERWKEGIEGTINSVFRMTKKVLPIMIKQKKGTIINISSIYGSVAPDPNIYHKSGFDNPPEYGAGKAAIIQFTKYIATHYAKFGIKANSISPGAFPNNQVQKNKKFIFSLKKKIPMGRIGKPEDLKGITIFLASNASDYVTGQNIFVDGGWTSW